MLWKDEFEIVTTADDEMIYNLVASIQPDVLIVEAQPTVRLQRKFEILKSKSPALRIVVLCPSEIKDVDFSERLRHFVDAIYTEPIDIVKFGKSVQSMEWM
jgi:predicted glycosyltransferase